MPTVYEFEVEPFTYAETDQEGSWWDAVTSWLNPTTEATLIRNAIQQGQRDANRLTDLVFYKRHPERQGRSLSRSDPNFDQLSREWLDIRDRLVQPSLRTAGAGSTPPSTTTKPALPATSQCPDSPAQWGRENLPKMKRWWQDKDLRAKQLLDVPVGSTLRAMAPRVFPAVPVEVFFGFCANATVTENTTEGVRAQPFHEMGLFGTEGGPRSGPAPNPDPNAEHNNWGKLASHPLVRQLLGGRSATMEHNRWKTQIPDQVAVGLVNLHRNGEVVIRHLDASIRPNASSSSPFFVACCFMGWSAGEGTAANHINQFKADLAGLPEPQRWGRFLQAVAQGIQSGRLKLRGLKRHSNVAYSALRTWQKIAAGQLLAQDTSGAAAWFNTGLGSDEASIADTITCAANAAR